MRLLSGLVLLATIGTANAVPVTASAWWQWKIDNAVNAGTAESISIVDSYYQNRELIDLSQQSNSTYGASSAHSFASMTTSSNGDDYAFSFAAATNQSVDVTAAANLPTEAYAIGTSWLSRMLVTFEVTEAVLFTGSFDLHDLIGGDSGSPFAPGAAEYQSGSMIGPGTYVASFVGERLSSDARSGQSFQLSDARNYSWDFVSVPVPATIPLLLTGLAAVAWMRRKRV